MGKHFLDARFDTRVKDRLGSGQAKDEGAVKEVTAGPVLAYLFPGPRRFDRPQHTAPIVGMDRRSRQGILLYKDSMQFRVADRIELPVKLRIAAGNREVIIAEGGVDVQSRTADQERQAAAGGNLFEQRPDDFLVIADRKLFVGTDDVEKVVPDGRAPPGRLRRPDVQVTADLRGVGVDDLAVVAGGKRER